MEDYAEDVRAYTAYCIAKALKEEERRRRLNVFGN